MARLHHCGGDDDRHAAVHVGVHDDDEQCVVSRAEAGGEEREARGGGGVGEEVEGIAFCEVLVSVRGSGVGAVGVYGLGEFLICSCGFTSWGSEVHRKVFLMGIFRKSLLLLETKEASGTGHCVIDRSVLHLGGNGQVSNVRIRLP